MDRTVSLVYNTGAWKGGFQLRICTILSKEASGLGQYVFPENEGLREQQAYRLITLLKTSHLCHLPDVHEFEQ